MRRKWERRDDGDDDDPVFSLSVFVRVSKNNEYCYEKRWMKTVKDFTCNDTPFWNAFFGAKINVPYQFLLVYLMKNREGRW